MSNEPRYDCAADATMSIIEGRWKTTIICMLSRYEVLRFSELKKKIKPISPRILSKQLRELVADGVVERNEIEGGSSRVEYSLTDKGRSLRPVLEQLAGWSLDNMFTNIIMIDD